MQATLDRRSCTRLPEICEQCFAEHLQTNDFETADCAVTVARNRRPEFTFKIYDRDGSIKTLIVTRENRSLALISWMALWEQQAGPVI